MLYLLITVVAFLGSLPMGLVNISVMHISGAYGRMPARRVSSGAVAGEIILASLALYLGDLVYPLFQKTRIDDWLLIVILTGAGIYFMFRQGHIQEKPTAAKGKMVFSGFLLGLVNPQSVPYWVFVLVSLHKTAEILHPAFHIVVFLAGVATGKFLALSLYSWSGLRISNLGSGKLRMLNIASGSMLMLAGLIQFVRLEWFM